MNDRETAHKRTNEELKKVLEEMRKCSRIQVDKIRTLIKENKELRQELKKSNLDIKDLKLELTILKRRKKWEVS